MIRGLPGGAARYDRPHPPPVGGTPAMPQPNPDSLILLAAQVAARAHGGQCRKYTGRPYVTHPARVAAAAMMQPGATVEMACAAWLHDVVEDCGIPIEQVADQFGDRVATLVAALTKAEAPGDDRAATAAAMRKQIAAAGAEAKIVKLLDRIDNLRELDQAPPEVRARYVQESKLLLDEALAGTSPELEAELRREIDRHQQMLAEQG